MTKHLKVIKRFLSKPHDFTYDEMKKLLNGLGYQEIRTGKTSGARAAFINKKTQHVIRFHKPHPKLIIKRYQLNLIEEELRTRGIIR
jgi:hypothetical protein